MRRSLLPLVAVVFVVVMSCTGSAVAYPVGHLNEEASEKVIRYWTPERMQQATPVSRASRPVPAAKPAKGGETSSAASIEVPQPYPSAYGKVFFTDNSGVNYVCSGTAGPQRQRERGLDGGTLCQ